MRGLLPADLLTRLRVVTDRMLDALSEEQKQRSGGQGSIFAMEHQDPVFSELIALPETWHALHALGFPRPRYWSGFVIAKEPHSGPLYWHQDWPFWDDPVSADPLPHQLFLMWYLVDTRPENGCLRLLPCSHRLRCDVHDTIDTGHDDTVRHEDPATSPAYRRRPDEVDVPVRAGDLVIGDARLLHAAHGNATGAAPHRDHHVVPAALRRVQRTAARRLSGAPLRRPAARPAGGPVEPHPPPAAQLHRQRGPRRLEPDPRPPSPFRATLRATRPKFGPVGVTGLTRALHV